MSNANKVSKFTASTLSGWKRYHAEYAPGSAYLKPYRKGGAGCGFDNAIPRYVADRLLAPK